MRFLSWPSWAMRCAGLCVWGSCLAGTPELKPEFTILFTAEAHAALLPCDCPLEPFGGVSRRATLIQSYRARGPVFLVDAGGWAGGGLYDEGSDGDPNRDALRTQLMLQAMTLMKYDALAWGSEEWSYRELDLFRFTKEMPGPLAGVAEALVFPLNGKAGAGLPEVTPYPTSIQKKLNGFAVKGLAFSRPLATAPPGKRLPGLDAKALAEALTGADFRIGLCSLGEEDTEAFAAEVDGFDLLINAGRKVTTRTAWRVGATTIANFDYEVQRMGVVEVFSRSDGEKGGKGLRWKVRVRHEPISSALKQDPEVEALLAPHKEALHKKGKRTVTVEYWTMGQCPFCVELRPEIERIAGELAGRVVIEPHFLVGKTAEGALRSLHGEEELQEDRLQALVYKYYPERYWDWVRWRETKGNLHRPWEEGVKALGLLAARLRGALRLGEADELLERDYQLSLRRGIQGTPTLVMANRVYDGDLERIKILQRLCGLLDEPRPEACKTVPACFFDAQCRKRGYVGRCLEAGTPKARCDFSTQAVSVPLTVLVESDALWSNHERILEILVGYLPGLEWKWLDPFSEAGARLVKQHGIDRLPAYVLDPVAKTEVGYAEQLERVVKESEGCLLVKGEAVGSHRLLQRKRIRGRADLFVARFSKSGQEAVEVAWEAMQSRHERPDVFVHDVLVWKETTAADGRVRRELAAPGGVGEIEEAALAFAVREVAAGKIWAYLKARGECRASLYWDRALKAAGIEVAAVRALAEGPQPAILQKMHAVADELKALGAGGNVVFLAENCELIPVQSRQELQQYLSRIGERKVEPAPLEKR